MVAPIDDVLDARFADACLKFDLAIGSTREMQLPDLTLLGLADVLASGVNVSSMPRPCDVATSLPVSNIQNDRDAALRMTGFPQGADPRPVEVTFIRRHGEAAPERHSY